MTEKLRKMTIAEAVYKYMPEINTCSIEAEQAATSLFDNMLQTEIRVLSERDAPRKRVTRVVGITNSSLLPDRHTK